jgi:LacI family sucrose operon transcriptional repressor
MRAHDLEPRVMAYGYDTSLDERRAAIETWLTVNACDGVFASDDLTALMALEWARKTGRRVPDDLRIVGYDGAAALQLAVPGLTTIRQPIERMATRAVDLLLERMTDATASAAAEEPLPVALRHGWTS